MQHITYRGRHLCSGRKVPLQTSKCDECAKKLGILMGILRSAADREGEESDAAALLAWMLSEQNAGYPLPF